MQPEEDNSEGENEAECEEEEEDEHADDTEKRSNKTKKKVPKINLVVREKKAGQTAKRPAAAFTTLPPNLPEPMKSEIGEPPTIGQQSLLLSLAHTQQTTSYALVRS